MKLREEHKKSVIIIFFSLIAVMVVVAGLLIQNKKNILHTQAVNDIPAKCNCNDLNNCYPDGCSGKPKTEDNKYDDARYNQVCKNIDFGWPPDLDVQKYFCSIRQPDSCFDIYRYKENRFACFMERWFCHPTLCEGSSGGSGCGKYWKIPDGWDSFGCVKKENGQTVPFFGPLPPGLPDGSQPTSSPQPTTTPKPPTHTPIPQQPTNTPSPTKKLQPEEPTNPYIPPTVTHTQQPVVTAFPTNPPFIPRETTIQIIQIPTSMPTLPRSKIEIKTPKEMAREVINPENIQKLNEKTEIVLEAPKKGIVIIKNVDTKIEQTAESWIFKIRIFIENLFR